MCAVVQITGIGYPPLAVRALVSQLYTSLSARSSLAGNPALTSITVAGLFDYNPHGADILLCYKFGSARFGLESALHTVPTIRWIGKAAFVFCV